MFKFIKAIYSFSQENPDLIKPYHWAVYMVAVEKCNQLSWKEKFGLPTDYTMELSGIASRKTYYKCLRDLVEFGLIKIHRKSANQYQSAVISLGIYNTGNVLPNVQAEASRDIDSVSIIKPLKNSKDFQNNNSIGFFSDLVLENKVFVDFLTNEFQVDRTEIKNMLELFLTEKISSKENLKWKNEAGFYAHFRNWLSKKVTTVAEEISIQKAERR